MIDDCEALKRVAEMMKVAKDRGMQRLRTSRVFDGRIKHYRTTLKEDGFLVSGTGMWMDSGKYAYTLVSVEEVNMTFDEWIETLRELDVTLIEGKYGVSTKNGKF